MATLYRKSKNTVWYLNYRVDGKRYRKSTGTKVKKLAEFKRAALEKELILGTSAEHRSCSIKDHFQRVSQHLKQNRTHNYARVEIPRLRSWQTYFENVNVSTLDKIQPKHVDDLFANHLVSSSIQTKKHYLKTIKLALNLAVTWGVLKFNPLSKVKPPKVVKGKHFFYEPEEIKLLLESATLELRIAIIILVNTGMRRGELWGLRWRDIDFKNGQIRVMSYDEHTTKSKRSRAIAMNDQCLQAVHGLSKRKLDDPVYRLVPSIDCLTRRFRRLVDGLGLKGNLHSLRHTFASLLVRRGVDMRIVQELLGHASIQQTMEYSYLAPSAHAEQVNKLDFQ